MPTLADEATALRAGTFRACGAGPTRMGEGTGGEPLSSSMAVMLCGDGSSSPAPGQEPLLVQERGDASYKGDQLRRDAS